MNTGKSDSQQEASDRLHKSNSASFDSRSKRKSSLNDKSKKPEKISNTKILLVYLQSFIIVVIGISCFYLNFKISRISPKLA